MNTQFLLGCLALVTAQLHMFGDDTMQMGSPPPANQNKEFEQDSVAYSARVYQIDDSDGCCDPASRLQIGGNYTRVSIKPKGHNTFSGNLGGAQGMYEYRPMNNVYAGVKLDWREGTAHGSAGKRSLFYIDTQERLGYSFDFDCETSNLTLFTGFGYRYYGQKFTPKKGSSVSFDYNEIYVPVGFAADSTFNCWFNLGLGFTWMPQVYPTVKIEPLKGARWILNNRLNNYYVEIPSTFSYDSFALILTPFYEYWQDGSSTAKSATGESLGLPGNTYDFGGVNLNFSYSF